VNGRQVTTADVLDSFTRQRELRFNASSLVDIDQITAVDPQTLRLTIKAPNVDFLVILADFPNKIVAREVVEEKGDLKTGPVIGSGAWIHEEWVQNSVVRLRRNPDYFGKDEKGRARFVVRYAEAPAAAKERAWQDIERIQRKVGRMMRKTGKTEEEFDRLLQEKEP
jgi:ABC-type transport system substrate-binding protein